MGQSKRYSEPETRFQHGSRPSNSSNKTKKAGIIRGSFVKPPSETIDLSGYIRIMLLRLKRNRVALSFQIRRQISFIFHRHLILKLCFLASVGYYFFFYEQSDPALPFTPSRPLAVETKLDFSSGKGISKPFRPKTKSETSPVTKNDLDDSDAAEYIDRFEKIARTEMNKFGVPASISLAQGLIESRAGNSKLAKLNNNHFGIKCFLKNCKPGHCSNYTDDSHKDFFRIFKNPWDCWRAHSQMISTGRYAKLRKCGHDYKKWAYGLKSVGYATDPNYADKLIGVIEKHHLNKYDH